MKDITVRQFMRLQEDNPYHDEKGQFASGPGGKVPISPDEQKARDVHRKYNNGLAIDATDADSTRSAMYSLQNKYAKVGNDRQFKSIGKTIKAFSKTKPLSPGASATMKRSGAWGN